MFFSARCSTFTLGICIWMRVTSGTDLPTPYVAWSMDDHNGTKMYPEYNNGTRFVGDLGPFGAGVGSAVLPGIVGEAILVDMYTFDIASDLGRKDCIKNPGVCPSGGLSITFWLKLDKWNFEESQVIFRTTSSGKTVVGVYFGKGSGDTLAFYVLRAPRDVSHVEFDQSYAMNTWAHIGLSWRNSTILTYINGSLISTTSETISETIYEYGLSDFVIGSSVGPTFMLDELKVFYDTLSEEQILAIFANDTGLISTTPRVDTSASTEPVKKDEETTPIQTTTVVVTSNKVTHELSTSNVIPSNQNWRRALYISLAVMMLLLLIGMCLLIFFKRRKRQKRQIDTKIMPDVVYSPAAYRDPDVPDSDRQETDNDADGDVGDGPLIRET